MSNTLEHRLDPLPPEIHQAVISAFERLHDGRARAAASVECLYLEPEVRRQASALVVASNKMYLVRVRHFEGQEVQQHLARKLSAVNVVSQEEVTADAVDKCAQRGIVESNCDKGASLLIREANIDESFCLA